MKAFLICCMLILPAFLVNAQEEIIEAGRIKISINDNWRFFKGPIEGAEKVDFQDEEWEKINIPHTWNALDPFDEVQGYYRGDGWYRKKFNVTDADGQLSDKSHFLYFEAANQVARVYLNGEFIGEHIGGYTAFAFDITDQLQSGKNILTVHVNNEHHNDIVPLRGDFNFYGGIYRDVFLISTGDLHFDVVDYASPGIKIITPKVTKEGADVTISGTVINETSSKQRATVALDIYTPDNKVAAQKKVTLQLLPGSNKFNTEFRINDPKLWSPESPDLYSVRASIETREGILKDQLSQPLGLRYFHFDADSGFYLNGEHVKLIGVNRHQDYPGLGNALSNERHLEDIKLIKSMGANFLRTAHYPQDPAILEACDRLGLLVSMEIPLDHDITDSDGFYRNSSEMMREMIRQFYNHPSIIIWAYMNEMFLGRNLTRDGEFIEKTVAYAKVLEELTRKEDPYRYTMIPNHGDFDVYHKSGLTDIPMIVGWNLYYGWYENDVEGFGKFVDNAHAVVPDKPIIITEYGAGADSRISSLTPLRFDFSTEWLTYFHHSHIKQILERPHIAGAAVWNMFDFGSENRRDAVPHINNKGLTDFDRAPKDAFYLYKSYLSEEPFFRITKPVIENTDSTYQVTVISNLEEGELILNYKNLERKSFHDNVAIWEITPGEGQNILMAQTNDQSVMNRVSFTVSSDKVNQYYNLGADFHFTDPITGITWSPIPQSSYTGGINFQPRDRGIGTDREILGTDNDPLFQTQVIGIENLNVPAPVGKYRLTFLFAELENKKAGERVYNVFINGRLLMEAFDLAKEVGVLVAVEKIIEFENNQESLDIRFEPMTGGAVLNGLSIQKIY